MIANDNDNVILPEVEDAPLVSIIIVNYNAEKFLEKCILSLSEQTFRNFEIILVDNASSDYSVGLVQKLETSLSFCGLKIKMIRNSTNLGFGAANNIGIHSSKGKYIVLLNPDTWVLPTWLEELVKASELDTLIGICQSKLLYTANKKINTTGNLCDIYLQTGCRGVLEDDNGQYDNGLWDFFFPSGASCLIKRNVLKEIGDLDEDLFLYCDDLDLGWRARLAGYKIRYVPNSVCFHEETYSKVSNFIKSYFIIRNTIHIFIKNYSFENIIFRFWFTLFINIYGAFLQSISEKKVEYILLLFKALLWNLLNLHKAFSKRIYVQSSRLVNDKDIERFMMYYYPFMSVNDRYKVSNSKKI